jgi:cysteine desulfuration protein SufE
MTIDEKQKEIVESFSLFDEWTDKYEYLIDLGKKLPQISEDKMTDEYLVKGCQSRVWLNADLDGKVLKFKADSDAIVTKGIIALLIKVLDGHTPKQVLDADLYFIDEIGLKEHLSPTRANGLVSMIKQMKVYAMAFNDVVKN